MYRTLLAVRMYRVPDKSIAPNLRRLRAYYIVGHGATQDSLQSARLQYMRSA